MARLAAAGPGAEAGNPWWEWLRRRNLKQGTDFKTLIRMKTENCYSTTGYGQGCEIQHSYQTAGWRPPGLY